MRSPLILGLLMGLAPSLPCAPAPPALVLTLEAPVQWRHGGPWHDVELGQLFGPGDELRCGDGGTLLLSLDAGVSLALEPGAQLRLHGGAAGGRLALELAQGRVDLLGGQRDDGAGVTLRTPNAQVELLGPDAEVYAAGPQETQVTVSEGRALLGDLGSKRRELVEALQRRRLTQGRLLAAEPLAKREIFPLADRWGRMRQFHGQRQALRRALLASKDHAPFVRALQRRQAAP